MFFELWDTETRNLLYDFDTLDEALEAARELVTLNPGVYPGKMALARVDRVDDRSRTTWLAEGDELGAMLHMTGMRTA